MTALPDPCPLPGSKKRRGLGDKDRLLYAPMADVGGLLYDKDAVYIDIPDWKVLPFAHFALSLSAFQLRLLLAAAQPVALLPWRLCCLDEHACRPRPQQGPGQIQGPVGTAFCGLQLRLTVLRLAVCGRCSSRGRKQAPAARGRRWCGSCRTLAAQASTPRSGGRVSCPQVIRKPLKIHADTNF